LRNAFFERARMASSVEYRQNPNFFFVNGVKDSIKPKAMNGFAAYIGESNSMM